MTRRVNSDGSRPGRRVGLFAAVAVAATLGVASVAGAFGTFKPKVDYAVGDAPEGLAVADFNGDGRKDLAAVSYGDELVSVLTGKKNGKFAAAEDYPFPTGTGPYDAARGDFNGDGRPDLAVTEYSDARVAIVLTKKGGKLGAPTSYQVGNSAYGVAVGDVNGDGRPDVVVADEGDDTISLRLGKKGGKLGSRQVFATGAAPYYLACKDFDRDGYADVAVAAYSDEQVEVRFGKKNGTFGSAKTIPTGVGTGPYPITTADFNGDNRPDIATGNYGDGSASVILTKKDRKFAAAKNFPVTAASDIYAIAAADFNLDNRPDLVVGSDDAATADVLKGKKGVEFGAPTPYPIGVGVYEIVTGKFNSDKAPDFASVNDSDDTVSVLINK